jgi:hypothetical protein
MASIQLIIHRREMHGFDREYYSYCSNSSGNNSNCDHTTFTKKVTATDRYLIGNHIPFLVPMIVSLLVGSHGYI